MFTNEQLVKIANSQTNHSLTDQLLAQLILETRKIGKDLHEELVNKEM